MKHNAFFLLRPRRRPDRAVFVFDERCPRSIETARQAAHARQLEFGGRVVLGAELPPERTGRFHATPVSLLAIPLRKCAAIARAA